MGYEAYTNARDSRLRNMDVSLNALAEGRQAMVNREAGNALQGGDYTGAAGALFQAGNIRDGLAVQGAGRRNQADDLEQQRTAILAVVTGLRQIPAEQRGAMLQQIGPRLAAYGVTPEQLGTVAPEDLSDQGLDGLIATMGGEVQRPRVIQGYRGALDEIDPYSNTVRTIRAPQQQEPPAGYRWKDDGGLEMIPGGPADPRVAGSLATSRRAPPRPRASGGGSRSGSASPAARAPVNPTSVRWD